MQTHKKSSRPTKQRAFLKSLTTVEMTEGVLQMKHYFTTISAAINGWSL